MVKKLTAVLFLLVFLAQGMIASAQGPGGNEAGKTAPEQSPASVTKSENYRLAANDMVHIKVFQEDELDTSTRISKDGAITFPFIGSVRVVGSTVEEAAKNIRERLREYIVNPQVTVLITDYSKRRFTVLGQVSKPGTYDMPDDSSLNLLEALGMAGGYTRIANPTKIILKRRVNGSEVIFKLNAKSMSQGENTSRFEVLPGDTIFVGESLI